MAGSAQGVSFLEGHRDLFLTNPTEEIYGDNVQWLPWDGMGLDCKGASMRGSYWGDANILKGTLTVGQSSEFTKNCWIIHVQWVTFMEIIPQRFVIF